MGQIDELSQMIGSIQADVLHIRRNTEVADSKLDKLSEQSIIQGEQIKSAHKRIDEIVPIANDWKATKEQGKGATKAMAIIASFFGTAAGLVGAGLGYLLKHLFG